MTPSPQERGLTVARLATDGRFDEIRDLFAPSLRSLVNPEVLRGAWTVDVERHGPVTSLGDALAEPAGPTVTLVKVPVTGERGTFTLLISMLSESSELVGLQLAPLAASEPTAPWEPPGYADPARFTEHELTLGTGPLAVPATLTLPRAASRRPAVVLLAGSGPMDRDETIGRNRPLKDLAWGLASRGVAVVRFDKVTFTHPGEVRQLSDFTVVDEYAPAAHAALQLLVEHSAVDPSAVFLAGHSLGGTVAPRIARAEPSLAGVVVMAGGSVPLHQAILRQFEYLASLDPQSEATFATTLDAVRAQVARVDAADLSPTTPASDLPFAVPAPYWLDLRDYDPVAVAAALPQPLLLLQGGRDYQATIEDDLARWNVGLERRRDVTVRIYPHDNHLFFRGEGRSSPAEYEPVNHVDPRVVVDLATWIVAGRLGPEETAP